MDLLNILINASFHWTDLLQPQWYLENGGLWLLLLIVFAETGLFFGFWLPGDSLLFVAGIYSTKLASGLHDTGNDFLNLLMVIILVIIAGVLGDAVGYWFGKKSGPALYRRKDSFFFKQRYLLQTKEFYEKHGGITIVVARFLPFIRTFAPIVAGIVQMDRKKFTFYNITGCIAWVFSMMTAGHYLHKFFLGKYNIDLTAHLDLIVLFIVIVTTLPIFIKLYLGRKKSTPTSPQ